MSKNDLDLPHSWDREAHLTIKRDPGQNRYSPTIEDWYARQERAEPVVPIKDALNNAQRKS